MPDLDVRAIRSEITKQKAEWKPKQHGVARSSAQRRARRLSVPLDESRLAELKKVPDPDMVQLVADLRGMRAPEAGEEAAEPRGRGELEADAFDDALDTSAAAAVGRVLARRPAKVDWRRRGRKNVTPVKDQEFCGACVSFGAIAVLESMLLIDTTPSSIYRRPSSSSAAAGTATAGGRTSRLRTSRAEASRTSSASSTAAGTCRARPARAGTGRRSESAGTGGSGVDKGFPFWGIAGTRWFL